jgi:hypothetical protein
VEWFIAFGRLRDRLGEVVKGRPEQVIEALGAAKVDRALWAVGRSGRAVTAKMIALADGENFEASISEPLGGEEDQIVPGRVRGYAAFTLPLAEWVRRGREAYLASQGADARAVFREGWAKFEQQYGFDVDRDLIDHLGHRFIVHDFPPHPLGIPVLWTYLIETDGAEAEIRRAIDGMMLAWQNGLPRNPEDAARIASPAQLRRTDDGIWNFQLGLAGPAVGVGGKWIVLSFSPAAVRENLAHLGKTPR